LLVLDDARDHAHVESLLPGTGDCLTLITSRRHLTALDGAVDLPLDVLTPDAAAELFIALSRRTTTTDSERAAIEKIVRMCGYLPLAIVLLAGRLAHHRTWSIADLAAEFADAQDRLEELAAGPRSVQAAFTMSYRDLPAEQKHMFRCLGIHPGSDTDAHAAAALADISVNQAKRRLEALYTDHFVEETRPGRYRLHDLLRAYARSHSGADTPEHNAQAMNRLVDYYQATAAAADTYVASRTQPAMHSRTSLDPGRRFEDGVQALSWLRTERDNIIACLDHVSARSPQQSLLLIETLAGLLEREGPWSQASSLHERALAIARRTGDQLGEADALSNLGIVLEWTGDYTASTELYLEALSLYSALGNRLGEANSYSNLGSTHRQSGDYDVSIDMHERGLELHRELGNRLGEDTLMVFGLVRKEQGDYPEAVALYQQANAVFRELGNQSGAAYSSLNLGDALTHLGDYTRSTELHQEALKLFRAMGYRFGEAETLTSLIRLLSLTGDYATAAGLQEQALALQREIGSRSAEAFALTKLGEMRRLVGDHVAATELLEQALVLSQEIGHQRIQTEALNNIGRLLYDTGKPPGALEKFAAALELARAIHSQYEQARALEGSALCREALGDLTTAVSELQEAVQHYRRLEAPELAAAAARLTQWNPRVAEVDAPDQCP
jgi:tetratricopeptide (TPR) repeat protein